MRSLLTTFAAGTTALLLGGCPDLPGGPVPTQSDSFRTASRPVRTPRESATYAPGDSPVHDTAPQHRVGEIAWFQGTIDEAFSRRGCSESHSRRTLFRF